MFIETPAQDQSQQGIPNGALNPLLAQDRPLMIVFSPYAMSNQVLRPYTFHFSPKLGEQIVEQEKYRRREQRNGCVYSDSMDHRSPELFESCLPDMKGINLDMSVINNSWFFFLVTTSHPGQYNDPGRLSISPNGTKTFSSGYFLGYEEPINIRTGTTNPHAYFVITKRNVINWTTSVNAIGDKNIFPTSNLDVVGNHCAQLLNTDASGLMYSGMPNVTDVISSSDGGASSMYYGDNCVCNTKGTMRNIDNATRSPTQNIGMLARAMGSAVYNYDTTHGRKQYSPNGITPLELDDTDPVSDCMRNMAINLYSTNVFSPKHNDGTDGLNLNQVHSMEYLEQTFPGLEIRTFLIRPDAIRGYSGIPQDSTMDEQMVGSFLISSALPDLLCRFNLADISFAYRSYTTGLAYNPNPGWVCGVWEILGYHPSIDMSQQQQIAAIEAFETRFESEIAPVLLTLGGHFKLVTSADMMNVTTIVLNFQDKTSNRYGPDEMFESSAKLGGLLNPMLGTSEQYMANANQLRSLAEQVFTQMETPGIEILRDKPVVDTTTLPQAPVQQPPTGYQNGFPPNYQQGYQPGYQSGYRTGYQPGYSNDLDLASIMH